MTCLVPGVYKLRDGTLLVRGMDEWYQFEPRSEAIPGGSVTSQWRLAHRHPLTLTVAGIERGAT